jgi:3-oxoacyl-[acyl-carrier protein] reductase
MNAPLTAWITGIGLIAPGLPDWPSAHERSAGPPPSKLAPQPAGRRYRVATAAALATLTEAGAIQVLVNNAGIHDDAVFPGMSGEQWDRVLDVSLNGFYNVTQPLTMPMIRKRWGRIVSISSIAGLMGNRGQVNYAAAKGALHAASKSLALELASRGITVNAVAPGIIETDMIEGAFDAEAIKRLVPMQRAGRAHEVAELVAFLVSDKAAYVSGQVISINGAMC